MTRTSSYSNHKQVSLYEGIERQDLFDQKKKDFALSVVTGPQTLNKSSAMLSSTGPAGSGGYLDRFSYKRVQVLGETEISYLQTFNDDELYERLKAVFEYGIPCLIVTKALRCPPVGVPGQRDEHCLLSSRLTTEKLMQSLGQYLQEYFAPKRSIHGT
jgi:HPr kinase/phosphorylase